MGFTQQDFDALTGRLEAAVSVLRTNGCLMQALARKYYLLYAIAKYAAERHEVKATHFDMARRPQETQKFHHSEMADLIRCLYTGMKKGTISDSGTCPGIVGANYTDAEAWRLIEVLYGDRTRADYGPGSSQEPYTESQADDRLNKAEKLAEDLRKLL